MADHIVQCATCERWGVWVSRSSAVTSRADAFITFIDGVVHRASHYAPYVRYNIYTVYTYNTIYVLSCIGCDCGIYVYHGDMTYMAALCMIYV